jgi:hypothetical protein
MPGNILTRNYMNTPHHIKEKLSIDGFAIVDDIFSDLEIDRLLLGELDWAEFLPVKAKRN